MIDELKVSEEERKRYDPSKFCGQARMQKVQLPSLRCGRREGIVSISPLRSLVLHRYHLHSIAYLNSKHHVGSNRNCCWYRHGLRVSMMALRNVVTPNLIPFSLAALLSPPLIYVDQGEDSK